MTVIAGSPSPRDASITTSFMVEREEKSFPACQAGWKCFSSEKQCVLLAQGTARCQQEQGIISSLQLSNFQENVFNSDFCEILRIRLLLSCRKRPASCKETGRLVNVRENLQRLRADSPHKTCLQAGFTSPVRMYRLHRHHHQCSHPVSRNPCPAGSSWCCRLVRWPGASPCPRTCHSLP